VLCVCGVCNVCVRIVCVCEMAEDVCEDV